MKCFYMTVFYVHVYYVSSHICRERGAFYGLATLTIYPIYMCVCFQNFFLYVNVFLSFSHTLATALGIRDVLAQRLRHCFCAE